MLLSLATSGTTVVPADVSLARVDVAPTLDEAAVEAAATVLVFAVVCD